LEVLGVFRLCLVGASVDEDSDWETGLPSLHQLVGKARVLHIPEADVDSDLLIADQVEHRLATILESRVAQAFRRRKPYLCQDTKWRGDQGKERDDHGKRWTHCH